MAAVNVRWQMRVRRPRGGRVPRRYSVAIAVSTSSFAALSAGQLDRTWSGTVSTLEVATGLVVAAYFALIGTLYRRRGPLDAGARPG